MSAAVSADGADLEIATAQLDTLHRLAGWAEVLENEEPAAGPEFEDGEAMLDKPLSRAVGDLQALAGSSGGSLGSHVWFADGTPYGDAEAVAKAAPGWVAAIGAADAAIKAMGNADDRPVDIVDLWRTFRGLEEDRAYLGDGTYRPIEARELSKGRLRDLPPHPDDAGKDRPATEVERLQKELDKANASLAKLGAAALPGEIIRKQRALLAEFNSKFMIVCEAGKATIFAPRHDHVLNRRCVDRMDTGDLAKLYMNRTVPSGTDKHGNVVYEPVAPWWLKHPKRRQFIAGVKFDPTGKREPGVYNLWQGFAVNPQPGDWTMMREHIQHVVCGNDAARFNYLMGWMARMFQDPASRGEVAVVMKGLEGTGKGTLANCLAHIIGQHAMAISNAKHLVGNFNSHLQDCLFLFADEAFFAGDKAGTGVLKSLVTEPHLTIEGKYRNAVLARNYLHIMMASNETWVVPASLEARRFFVLDVTDDCRGQHEYFTAMQAQMEAGGYAAMLHDLMAYDLSDFNVRVVPETEALQQQKVLSLNGPDGWWLDVLHRGYVLPFGDGLNSAFEWAEEFTTDSLYRDYCEYAEHRREWRVLPRETLGRFLKRMGGQSVRISVGNHRPMGYLFGPLEAARAAFTQSTGLTQDWEAEAS